MASNLPEVYHTPQQIDHGPEVMRPGDQSQSLPPYKNEYAQQIPQTTWSPPPQNYPPPNYPPQNYPPQNYPPQNYPPQNYPPAQNYPLAPPQPQLQVFPQQPQQAARKGRICGMKKVMFWIVLVVVIVVIGVAVGVGVSLGVLKTRKKGSSGYTPYALETGAWNINNVPLSQYNGICSQDYTTAVAGCGPLTFPFTLTKAGNSYHITNSPYVDMNGALTPPVNDGDMYSKYSYSSGQAPSVTAPCIATANVTVKLGKSYQYEFSNEHYSKNTCELNNGLTSTTDQGCDCFWFGFGS